MNWAATLELASVNKVVRNNRENDGERSDRNMEADPQIQKPSNYIKQELEIKSSLKYILRVGGKEI